MYILTWSNPALPTKAVPINVPVGAVVSNAASIRLTGKGAAAYGAIQQSNLLWMLENFASGTAPTYPTVGQEWYDTTNSILKVCTSTSPLVWKSLGGIQVTNVGDPAPSPTSLGDVWFQRTGTASGIMYVYTGLGRYPDTTTTIGGWNQLYPAVNAVAGREEYDAMLTIVNQLVGDPASFGGMGAVGKVLTLNDLTQLDAALKAAYAAQTPLDANVLTPTTDATTELLIDPNSQDWDLLLAAAKWAVDRLDLPAGYSSDISTMPFITDGRQAPTALTSLAASDIRYPALERRTNRKFGLVTLMKTYQETANVLIAAQSNRYAIKGINGANGANPTFASGVTTTTWTTFTGAPANTYSGGTISFLIPFGSAANLTAFLASGGAVQFRVSLVNGSTTGDTNMKAMFDQRGVIRLTADKGRTFANVAPYAQSAAIQSGAQASHTMASGATFGVSMTSVPVPGSLSCVISFNSTGNMAGNITMAIDIIRDTQTYGNGSVLVPAPTAYATADVQTKSPWIVAP